jgi:hypothetical protein
MLSVSQSYENRHDHLPPELAPAASEFVEKVGMKEASPRACAGGSAP